MKALSLWQPWASLLFVPDPALRKHNETRDWIFKHRGDLVIHAAQKRDTAARQLAMREPFRSSLRAAGFLGFRQLPFGALIGVVHVDDCVRSEGFMAAAQVALANGKIVSGNEVWFGNYHAGRSIIITSNPRRFAKPIPYRGAQGPFNVPDEVIGAALA